ncbi:MAG TPA: CehA/McbA family metallohydrolase [Labilithrix sp.]|nr:CehA/McbA family metallohydrolase [Labilithrix sp.]
MVDGAVPEGGPDHFFVDFVVPEGTKEIEIRHDDQSAANILDWGLLDQDGYRGWGGGTSEPIVIGEAAASRAYVPGPIKAGAWRLVVGKAKVVASPARYHVEIDFRAAPTLPVVVRKPYQVAAARKTETRYYAGDFHVHSRESTDAKPTLEANVALAKQRGLDFIEMSDHNTITQLDFFTDLQASEPAFLLIPGIEYTTYQGHANAIGATKWVDHKIGQPGVTIEGAADQILAQGAILSINHPALDLGDLCIGCAWKHDLGAAKIGGVEIGTGGLKEGAQLFSAQAIAFWDAILDKGQKIPALGGSDDHRAGISDGNVESPIGNPTTLVRAKELSVAGILEGIRHGATVVKLESPTDPMAELEVATTKGAADALGYPGDTVAAQSVVLRVKVTGALPADSQQVRFVKNGVPYGEPVDVTSDPFVLETIVAAPATGEERWRAEVVFEGKPLTVTSHVWLKLDPNGPRAAEAATDGGGCAVGSSSSSGLTLLAGALAFLGVAALRRRRLRVACGGRDR